MAKASRLTHPEKVLFADAQITKRDLAEYYSELAEELLVHVAGRPISLVRCPEGVDEGCFFQRHRGAGLPDALGAIPIRQSDGAREPHILIEDEAGLEACAQIGAIELHPWGARASDLERPERLVIDLDPGPGAGFAQVRQAARASAERLEAAGLTPFFLLTGGKGVHVIAPLEPEAAWDRAKDFAEALARELERADPDRYTASASREKRRGRVFVDWLRNSRGASAIAPYSPRAKPGAPVAAPIRRDELSRVKAGAYTMKTIRARLRALKADPWAGYDAARRPLPDR